MRNSLELRKHGAAYRQIADTLHVSLGTAYQDVKVELAAAVKLKNKRADELVELELQRLDQWLLALDKGWSWSRGFVRRGPLVHPSTLERVTTVTPAD